MKMPIMSEEDMEKVVKANWKVHGKTVLIVDDKPEYLEAGVAAIEYLGGTAITASNYHSACDKLSTGGIAAVVTDLMMPRKPYDTLKVELGKRSIAHGFEREYANMIAQVARIQSATAIEKMDDQTYESLLGWRARLDHGSIESLAMPYGALLCLQAQQQSIPSCVVTDGNHHSNAFGFAHYGVLLPNMLRHIEPMDAQGFSIEKEFVKTNTLPWRAGLISALSGVYSRDVIFDLSVSPKGHPHP